MKDKRKEIFFQESMAETWSCISKTVFLLHGPTIPLPASQLNGQPVSQDESRGGRTDWTLSIVHYCPAHSTLLNIQLNLAEK